MAGQIKNMLDRIIEERSHGESVIASTTRAKMILKGINPDNFTSASEDDPLIITKVREIANEFGVTI
jgi:hypothetical protein